MFIAWRPVKSSNLIIIDKYKLVFMPSKIYIILAYKTLAQGVTHGTNFLK